MTIVMQRSAGGGRIEAAMRQRWNKFRHALERRVRYRVTSGGLWFLAALALFMP